MRLREMRRGQRARSGNWRAGCLETSTSGSEEGGWKRAARAVPRQPPILLGTSVQKRSFEKRETQEKRGGNVKRERSCFLGKDAMLEWASAPGLVCEVLDTEPAWEQAHSTFLTHAAGSHPCERWRLVCPQISPYQLCHLFPIL